MLDKGKRPIDAEGFQVVSARKSFKPRQVSLGYSTLTIFDILHAIPSPDTLAALEDANHIAKKAKYPTYNPAINLEVNMEVSDKDSLEYSSMKIATFNTREEMVKLAIVEGDNTEQVPALHPLKHDMIITKYESCRKREQRARLKRKVDEGNIVEGELDEAAKEIVDEGEPQGPTVFDILHDISSPDTPSILEDACHTAEMTKYPTETPAINLEVNMKDNDEDSLEDGNTQTILNTPQ
ncbi:hypothetical protein L7F22_032917 [Adiantum nelumboides]|nr:hypothetical protein [Adiantum nelumboides]